MDVKAAHGPTCRLPWNLPNHPKCRTCGCCPGLIRLDPSRVPGPWSCYSCAITTGVPIPRTVDLEQRVATLLDEANNLDLLRDTLGITHDKALNLKVIAAAYQHREAKLELDCVSFLEELGWLPESIRCRKPPAMNIDSAEAY